MDNKPSHKHHYLPRRYLRGFADDNNSFFVYDKQNNRIFSQSPDTFYFENDLNTVEFPDGSKSAFLENLYTDMENTTCSSLDNIRNSYPNTPIEIIDKMNLFVYILFLHWRLPSNIELVDELSSELFCKNGNLDYFKIYDKTGADVPKNVVKQISSSRAFKKLTKIIAPFAPFFKNETWHHDLENWRFIYCGDDNPWYITGDNPIITKSHNDHDPVNCLKEFIFPISGKILLVSDYKGARKTLEPGFAIDFAAGIFERSQRFVACRRRDFLEALIEYYQIHVSAGKTDVIITELFKTLYNENEKEGR